MAESNHDIIEAVEKIYARALLELAEQAGNVNDLQQEVEQLAALLKREQGLLHLVGSRILSVEKRAASVERLFKGNVSDTLYRFLQVVNEKGRLAQLPQILEAFARLVDEAHGIVEVDAWVARPMSEDELKDVAARIGGSIKRRVVLHQYIDPELIGGLKLRIGDQLIDASVATQLRLLRDNLIATGRETARTKMDSLLQS